VRSEQVFAKALKYPKAFWAAAAKEIEWFKPWKKVLEWNCPWAKWFIGGNIKLQRRLYILLSFYVKEVDASYGRRKKRRA